MRVLGRDRGIGCWCDLNLLRDLKNYCFLEVVLNHKGVSDRRYRFSDYCFAVFFWGGPVVISSMITIFVPSEVLRSEAVRAWSEFVLQVAPKMLNVPAESKDPEFVILYHASMLSSLIIFVPIGVFYGLSKLKEKFSDGEGGRGKKIKIARDFILGLFCVLFSWAWFSWGYKGGLCQIFGFRERLF
ncbi:hypothetical protein LXM60_01935 [Pandoraea sputorum]|uniref:hypothetical protein n=1 Tax=Pandoraea sputorum TaxID=93222 RepID=UPI001E58A9BA|nr:hypothetical protein [Pandoraea sputorum]MCE4058971.1 hypothetical protein [Pandoraea sputorum]